MRRFAMTLLSLFLMLGFAIAQDPKTAAPKPAETAKDKPAPKEPPKPAVEAPLPSIPPEVEAKLEAARLAVAEAIVAAQDAGLVETTIDPPPVLDILVTGRALDLRELKASPRRGVSPEVFAAWFTGYGNKNIEGVKADTEVRIVVPSKGLQTYYDQRANLINQHIDAVRKAKTTSKSDAETKAKAAETAAQTKTAADAKTKADADAAQAKTATDAKAKADTEAAQAKAAADAKAKADAEAAQAKADAEAKSKAVAAAAQAKADADAAKKKADDEAAAAKKKADDEAKAKADADAEAKAKADTAAQKAAEEAKAKAEAEKPKEEPKQEEKPKG